jgi:hypothetical protein
MLNQHGDPVDRARWAVAPESSDPAATQACNEVVPPGVRGSPSMKASHARPGASLDDDLDETRPAAVGMGTTTNDAVAKPRPGRARLGVPWPTHRRWRSLSHARPASLQMAVWTHVFPYSAAVGRIAVARNVRADAGPGVSPAASPAFASTSPMPDHTLRSCGSGWWDPDASRKRREKKRGEKGEGDPPGAHFKPVQDDSSESFERHVCPHP